MSHDKPNWNYDMNAAPRNGTPILAWCIDRDPCPDCGPEVLCIYHAHADGLSRVEDGPHVVVWGGGFCDVGEYGAVEASLPDWWFRYGSDFEEAAYPTKWAPVP